MLFPESERVVYDKNPLASVICQLRFPPILKIDAELPSTFQDRIRAEYPLLKQRELSEAGFNLTPELSKVLGEEMLLSIRGGKRVYDFYSGDERWQLSLARGCIADT